MADSLKSVTAIVSFNKLINDDAYKLLRVLIREKKDLSQDQSIEGICLLNKVNLWKNNYQIESSKPNLEGTDWELSLAPLYSFLFVLVVFLTDELLRTTIFPFNDFLVSSLSFFTMFSSLYWCGKWMTYVVDIWRNHGQRTYTLISDGKLSRAMRCLHSGNLKNDWLRYSLAVAWFFILILLLYVVELNSKISFTLLVSVGLIFPFCVEGLYHLNPNEGKVESSDKGYRSTLNHFGRFLLLSIVLSIVFLILGSTNCFSDLLISYETLQILKISSVGFVIMNGLVIPSVVPFHTYRLLSNAVRKKPERMQQKVDKEIDDFLTEIKAFTHQCGLKDNE